jgi:hypothetical protein
MPKVLPLGRTPHETWNYRFPSWGSCTMVYQLTKWQTSLVHATTAALWQSWSREESTRKGKQDSPSFFKDNPEICLSNAERKYAPHLVPSSVVHTGSVLALNHVSWLLAQLLSQATHT